jgi:REP element-mobilizing transposase RayT
VRRVKGEGNRDAISIDADQPFSYFLVSCQEQREQRLGVFCHVLNRSVGRMHMFRKDADFEAFERGMVETHLRQPLRILSYCVLSNHWHFVTRIRPSAAEHRTRTAVRQRRLG